MFEAQARRTPGPPRRSRFDGRAFSYAELDERADRMARRLRSLGAGPEILVGVCLRRSIGDLVATLLGVLKAGAAYVPLDPTYPRERLAYLLEDSRVPILLITEGGLLDRLGPHSTRVTLIEDEEDGAGGDALGGRRGRRSTTWRTSSTPRARPAGPRGP